MSKITLVKRVKLPFARTKVGLYSCGEHEFIATVTSMKEKKSSKNDETPKTPVCPICDGWKYLSEYPISSGVKEYRDKIPVNLGIKKVSWTCVECKEAFDDTLGNCIKYSEKCRKCFPRKKNGKCLTGDCDKYATFNYPEEKIRLYCYNCKLDGMEDIKSRKCKCGKSQPRFNFPGEKRPEYCANCASPGMENIIDRKCKCGKAVPRFNFPGEKRPEYCSNCRLEGMENIKDRKCKHPDCDGTLSNFGYIGEYPDYCSQHAERGMVLNPRKRCLYKGCSEFACYGKKEQIYCEYHRDEVLGLRLMTKRVCKNPHKNDLCLIAGLLNEKELCRECDPGGHYKIREKVYEKEVEGWLNDTEDLNDYKHDKTFSEFHECFGKRYRPDFLWDWLLMILILEVDEGQHKAKTYECERNREVKIAQSFGGIPVIYIRYNPNAYKASNGKRYNPSEKYRKKVVLETLRYFKNYEPSSACIRIELFYDGYSEVPPHKLPIENVDYVKEAKA